MTHRHRPPGSSGFCTRKPGTYHDGFSDDLEPLAPLDLDRCETVSDLLNEMAKTSFGGRSLGEAADVLETMFADPDCTVVMTLSGAMTVAKMGLLVCRLIDQGRVQAIVSTGALMAHGFVESIGGTHFKHNPSMDDEALYAAGYNRVYDSLELEQNLDDTTQVVVDAFADWPADDAVASFEFHRELGRLLHGRGQEPGILPSAFRKAVPIFVPAFTDSELGLDFDILNRIRVGAGKEPLRFDPFGDIAEYIDGLTQAKRLGIFTIGGGVPRNWAQQMGPYLDMLVQRYGVRSEMKQFQYGVRICPEPVHWGGLSGCSYSEGISWGKFVPPAHGGRFAEVYCDATIAWPVLQMAVEQRLAAR